MVSPKNRPVGCEAPLLCSKHRTSPGKDPRGQPKVGGFQGLAPRHRKVQRGPCPPFLPNGSESKKIDEDFFDCTECTEKKWLGDDKKVRCIIPRPRATLNEGKVKPTGVT